MDFFWCFCVHDTAATRGQYLALSKAYVVSDSVHIFASSGPNLIGTRTETDYTHLNITITMIRLSRP